MELSTFSSIRELGEADYRRLSQQAPPASRFEWLDALERTGCVAPERGWLPMHLGLTHAGRLVGVAPAYVKGNSEGEFVFDHSWARFAEVKLGVSYYPKLVLAVPFTPANGPRLLLAPDVQRVEALAAFAKGLPLLCERAGLSGVHVLFCRSEEARVFAQHGWCHRYGVQFHWQNAGYGSFEEFLARMSSKRRNQIRRERRELERQGLVLETLVGADLDQEAVDLAFDFYKTTVDKYVWGRQYLSRAFFQEVAARMPESIHLALARERSGGRPIGAAFNLLGGDTLYGRYWGAWQERPFLHFNVCYYHGIEECIARGLSRFEPGAGGEHKLARGFEPAVTHSVHYLVDPRLREAVADFCGRERAAIVEHVEGARRHSVLRSAG